MGPVISPTNWELTDSPIADRSHYAGDVILYTCSKHYTIHRSFINEWVKRHKAGTEVQFCQTRTVFTQKSALFALPTKPINYYFL